MRHATKMIILIIVMMGHMSSAVEATQEQKAFWRQTVLVRGLEIPWGMAELPSGDLLITERRGELKRFDKKNSKLIAVKGVPKVHSSGQGGLLDVVLHPDFSRTQWVYLTYSGKVEKKSTTFVARAKLEADVLKEFKVLFKAEPALSGSLHYGSRLAFDGKGHLFVSIGERNERDYAQDLNSHLGKILRLNDDGTVAKDNPFIGQKNVRPEIWSYGHRNPQGLWYDRNRDELWEIEHGPRGGDEINLIKKGANYGWPKITHGREYWGPSIGKKSKEGMEQAVKYYVPSIAPSGLVLYSGKMFPEWKDSLFSGALVLTHLNRVQIKDGKAISEERLFADKKQRVRSVIEAADGSIYVGVDSGEIWHISSK